MLNLQAREPMLFVFIKLRQGMDMSFSTFPCICFRDLSEISRGGGGVETEGGSQLFEPQKREGS